MKEDACEILDVTQTPCPFHFFKTRDKLYRLAAGEILEVWSTKLGAAEIEKRFADEGQEILASWEEHGIYKVRIKRTG